MAARRDLGAWCAGEDWCPLTVTATLLGKKWHPIILYRLMQDGPLGFNALRDEIGDISGKVLSGSLEELEEYGLVDRSVVSERPYRVEYSLTETGQSLETVLVAMRDWGNAYLESTSHTPPPVTDS